MVEQWKWSNVKWYLLYQKKWKNDEWEDIKDIELNNLKKGEFVKIELDSSSVKILLENLSIIQDIYAKYWIQFGSHNYFINDENLDDIVKQISKFWDKTKLINALEKLESTDIENINNLVNVSWFKKILQEWDSNKTNSSEEYWQAFFTKHAWILSQVFSKPYIFGR